MLSVEQIRKYPLFDDLNEADLARLANCLTKRSFARGVYIYYPDSPGVNAYLVESGLVRIFFTTASGQEVLLYLAGPLEVFGFPTLQDEQLRVIGVMALQPSVLLSIGREDFFHLLDSSPQFSRNVYLELTIITRKLLLHVRTLTTLNINGRLASMLLRLATASVNQEHIVQLPISQEELAGWIGASRGRLNQAMKLLQQLGLISVEGRKIVILDYPGLVRMAEEQTLEKV